MTAFQQSMVRRFAMSQAVAIVSIALLFASSSNTVLPYVLGAGISFVLLAWHVWPSSRVVDRVRRRLDRAGGHSDLAQVLEQAS